MNRPANHQEQLAMSSHTTANTEADQLQQRVQRAISDPGSILPREKIAHLDGNAEPITQWSTRAVMAVIHGLQAERDTAVSLLAGDTPWPTDAGVLVSLHQQLDELDHQTRGGGAQGGEAPPENDRDGGKPSNVAPEPGRGTATPANTLRPDQATELDQLRELRLMVSQLLGISQQPDGLTSSRIATVLSEMVVMAGHYSMAAEQRDNLAAGATRVQQQIEHLPCLSPRCPEVLCSPCSAKKSLHELLITFDSLALTVDEIPAREVEGDADGPWYVRILDEPVHHTTTGAPVHIDWTHDGSMIGIEVLEAGQLPKEPS
ncbi:hypothetical protein ACFWMR_02230 [Amycolatopsis thailandensis]|uniref:hypothetical protein n=1 Tax=Amycolatopsis thailandensis TaxID=589330 RepID=UPI0036536936